MPASKFLVGVAGPLSGPRSAYGDLLQRVCVRRADNEKMSVMLRDDRAEPRQAVEVARDFVSSGVGAVIGHFNSDCARAAAAIYASAGVPLLLPASTLPSLTENRVAYRLCASDLRQIDAIARELGHSSRRGAAIWTDGSSYAERLRDMLQAAAPDTESLALMRRRGVEPDTVVCFGAHHNVSTFIGTINARQLKTRFICSDDCAIDAFADSVSGGERIAVATPVPSFGDCIERAFRLVEEFLAEDGSNLSQWLENSGQFAVREMCDAEFRIQNLK